MFLLLIFIEEGNNKESLISLLLVNNQVHLQ